MTKINSITNITLVTITGMGDRLRVGIPSQAVTSQLGQLSRASLRGRLIEYVPPSAGVEA